MFDYPHSPGFKARETSKSAAEAISPEAPTLRDKVMFTLSNFPSGLTADEVAGVLRLSPFAIRPRVSELARLGLVEDTMHRRVNASGRHAVVWRVK